MYIDELTELNKDMQKTIDTCSKKDNITMVLTGDLESFRQLVNELDPSKIDFTKGGYFNNKRIEAYWSKFSDLSPSFQTAVSRLKTHSTVVSNTLTVLNRLLKQASETTRQIKSEYAGHEADESLMAQFIVTDTYISVMENLVTEYKVWQDRISKITVTGSVVLEQAVTLARLDQRMGNYEKYKSDFAAMKSACVI